jgi:complex iron-sulfur molybdoenzyme family reductase subunit gamma
VAFLVFIPWILLGCKKAGIDPEAKALLAQMEAGGDLLVAKKIKQDIPLDPNSPLWNQAKEYSVPLISQNSVAPRSPVLKRNQLAVRALYNKNEFGMLLTWSDPTKNDHVTAAQLFQDAVAAEFPGHFGAGFPLPYIGMGNTGRPVNILQWNAAWQADIDQGYQGVEREHPGMVPDNAPLSFRTGEMAGSPLSKEAKTSPMANLLAEGFGSLTPAPAKKMEGKGVWQDGRWSVVIKRPLKVGSDVGFSFQDQGMVPIAFAIWDGELKERNGIKDVTRWRFLHLEEEAVPTAYLNSLVIGPLAGPDLSRGKQLLTDLGCIACHNLPGNQVAIELGPDLTYAGAIHRPEYLRESIQDPNVVLVPGPGYFDAKTKTSVMPAFAESINSQDLNYLVEFLRSQQ